MWSWPRIKRQKIILDVQEPVSWQHICVRPTQLGINLLFIAVATWMAALNYSVNLAYGLSFWIVSAMGVASLLSIRQLLGLRLRLDLPEEVFVGEAGTVTVHLLAQDLRNRRLIVRMVNEEAIQQSLSQDDLNVLHTHSNDLRHTQLNVATTHRGYQNIPHLQLISTAPFGLLEVSVVCVCTETFIVYPAPIEHTVALTGRPSSEEAGTQRQQGGDEVAYLKQFVDGSSLQTIAWKQYAKTGQLLSKHFEYPTASLPDVISYKDYPNIHAADQLASMLCYRVLQQHQLQKPFVLELPNLTILPQAKQRSLCLNALAVM